MALALPPPALPGRTQSHRRRADPGGPHPLGLAARPARRALRARPCRHPRRAQLPGAGARCLTGRGRRRRRLPRPPWRPGTGARPGQPGRTHRPGQPRTLAGHLRRSGPSRDGVHPPAGRPAGRARPHTSRYPPHAPQHRTLARPGRRRGGCGGGIRGTPRRHDAGLRRQPPGRPGDTRPSDRVADQSSRRGSGNARPGHHGTTPRRTRSRLVDAPGGRTARRCPRSICCRSHPCSPGCAVCCFGAAHRPQRRPEPPRGPAPRSPDATASR